MKRATIRIEFDNNAGYVCIEIGGGIDGGVESLIIESLIETLRRLKRSGIQLLTTRWRKPSGEAQSQSAYKISKIGISHVKTMQRELFDCGHELRHGGVDAARHVHLTITDDNGQCLGPYCELPEKRT